MQAIVLSLVEERGTKCWHVGKRNTLIGMPGKKGNYTEKTNSR